MARKLSRNAEKLLMRLRRGNWYPVFDKDTPKAMQELIDADLVWTTGRVAREVLCYVPSTDYEPFQREKFK